MEKTTDPLAEQEPDIPEAADGIDGQEGDNLPIESNTEEIYEPQPFMVENDGCASLIDQAIEIITDPEIDIPDDKRRELKRLMIRSWNAPLPDPESFKRYGEVVPTAPERLLTLLEEEQRGRIAYNFRVLDDKRDLHTFLLSNDNQESKRYHSFRMFGLFMAFFVVCVALGLGAFLIISGHSLAGLSSLLGGLGFLAGIFIFSKRNVFGSGTSILKQSEEESKDKNKS